MNKITTLIIALMLTACATGHVELTPNGLGTGVSQQQAVATCHFQVEASLPTGCGSIYACIDLAEKRNKLEHACMAAQGWNMTFVRDQPKPEGDAAKK